jgi:hypothetical protein
MIATERSWTCGGCGVSVSRIDGGRVSLPASWARSEAAVFCLTCRRSRASEAAERRLGDECKIEDRARARREGLVEFEVRRTPELSDGTIARACRTSAATVAAARQRLS